MYGREEAKGNRKEEKENMPSLSCRQSTPGYSPCRRSNRGDPASSFLLVRPPGRAERHHQSSSSPQDGRQWPERYVDRQVAEASICPEWSPKERKVKRSKSPTQRATARGSPRSRESTTGGEKARGKREDKKRNAGGNFQKSPEESVHRVGRRTWGRLSSQLSRRVGGLRGDFTHPQRPPRLPRPGHLRPSNRSRVCHTMAITRYYTLPSSIADP